MARSRDISKVFSNGVTPEEFLYLDGLTSSIQDQLNGKSATAHTHAISDVTNLSKDLSDKAPIDNPTFTGTITGKPSTAIATNGSSNIGYLGLPQNSSTTGAYAIAAADAGKHIYSTATRTITIPANSAVAFEVGTTIVFISGTSAVTTIQITSDTLRQVGTTNTGSRTLAANGMATIVKVSATEWYISGVGLS